MLTFLSLFLPIVSQEAQVVAKQMLSLKLEIGRWKLNAESVTGGLGGLRLATGGGLGVRLESEQNMRDWRLHEADGLRGRFML